MRKRRSPKQSETISKLAAHVNDQIGRERQRESEAGQGGIENIYTKLDLVSHKLAASAPLSSAIPALKRFTPEATRSPSPGRVVSVKTFSRVCPLLRRVPSTLMLSAVWPQLAMSPRGTF